MSAKLYTGPINTLNDCAAAGKNLMVQCQNARCGHMHGFDPFKLREYGKDIHLGDLEKRLTCTRCRHRGAKILIHMTKAERIAQTVNLPKHQPRNGRI